MLTTDSSFYGLDYLAKVSLIAAPVALFYILIIGLPIHFLLKKLNYQNRKAYAIGGFLGTLLMQLPSLLSPYGIGIHELLFIFMFGAIGIVVALTFREVLERLE